jgi:hypothetical protein
LPIQHPYSAPGKNIQLRQTQLNIFGYWLYVIGPIKNRKDRGDATASVKLSEIFRGRYTEQVDGRLKKPHQPKNHWYHVQK